MAEYVRTPWRRLMLALTCSLAAASLSMPMTAHAGADSLCASRGYTVGFFNGVWNTLAQAIDGRMALQALVGDSYNNEPIEYDNFYNTTGSSNDATLFQDVAEVFIQRAYEFDASGELGRRFEYLWETSTDSSLPFLSRIWNTMGAELDLLEGFYTYVSTKAAGGWSLLLSDPPTAVDYAQHRISIDTLVTEGQKMLFIAHSQGNLFVNPAYDYAKSKLSTDSVAAVHIAPASITLRGPHVLADIDAVINGLRVFGGSSVPPSNLTLPMSRADLSGHTLIGTYLDAGRAGRYGVQALANQRLAALATPMAKGSRGFFTAMLTWDGRGDVDLHAFEPRGTHVYYRNLRGQAGELDVDNTVAHGPEHYFASCNPAYLQEGRYRIGINNYARALGRTATVQVSFAQGGQPVTRVLDVGPERGTGGNDTPIPVLSVLVSRDASGRFTATAE
ncbi:hypothetical protein [Comamonas composti]|uniref:hypothetical protein n=1 Tax=Comamonas composti TaxID=408558 RepID=UPI000412CF84|nr:hypothetical protein [Comamonas composti]